VEVWHLAVLIELYLNVGLAWLLLHYHGFVGDQAVNRDDIKLLLLAAAP
jgi:hypothetical protein